MSVHELEPSYDPDYDPDYDNPTPAQEVTAEQSVLGAMLLTPTAITQALETLNPDDFYRPNHELIYDTIITLHGRGEAVDPITVAAELDRQGHLHKIGGAPYLHTLTANVPTAANAAYYAQIVRDKARLRTVEQVATRLRQIATQGNPNALEDAFNHAYETLDQAAARLGPTTAHHTGLADLTWLLTGTPPHIQPPTILTRTDGNHLFYPHVINGLFGDPEAGKTWIAQAAIAETLNNGGTAAMIDVDHNGPNHTAARLLLLGANPIDLANPQRFRYYDPEDAQALRTACQDITHHHPTITLIDSLGEHLAMLGASTNDGDDVTNAIRTTILPIATTGSCVITIDHLPKAGESRQSGYAIGSIAKKRMMRGAYYKVTARQQPAPGKTGRLTLTIEKDTPGKVREYAGGGYAGTFTLDSTNPAHTTYDITTADNPIALDGTFRPTHLMEAVSRYVELNDLCSGRDITDNIRGKQTAVREAIRLLIHEGYIATVEGARRTIKHKTIAIYREAEDPQNQPPDQD